MKKWLLAFIGISFIVLSALPAYSMMHYGRGFGSGMMGWGYYGGPWTWYNITTPGYEDWRYPSFYGGPRGYGYGYVMGPWIMRYGPYGMGYGMHGYGGGPWGYSGMGGMGWSMMVPWGYGYYNPFSKSLTIEQATDIAQKYLTSLNNPDLAIDKIEEYTLNFYVLFIEKSAGTNAFEMLVDKYIGHIYPEPGPNIMWNIKYGMMNGFQPIILTTPINKEQAKQIAQQFLDIYIPKTIVGDIHTFYGYYTMEVLKDGKVYGMLSVNGYTGQVWYHTWHGVFIQSKKVL